MSVGSLVSSSVRAGCCDLHAKSAAGLPGRLFTSCIKADHPLKRKRCGKNTVTFLVFIWASRIRQHHFVYIADSVLINWFNIVLYLWCADLATRLAWFMSSELPFIISCIPIFYFNFIEYHLLISTQTNDLLFWSILHSLRQMQLCCLCRSQSNLCSWHCPDFSLWKFLTTKVGPCSRICVAVLGNHAHKQCQNSQSLCGRLHEMKTHTVTYCRRSRTIPAVVVCVSVVCGYGSGSQVRGVCIWLNKEA